MRVSILSSRDTVPNIVFTLSFNVRFGPPSRVLCYYNYQSLAFFNERDDNPNLSREVVSQYVSSSQPDMTLVTVKVEQPFREERIYICAVTVEGRKNIVNGTYDYDTMGTGTTTVNVAGE